MVALTLALFSLPVIRRTCEFAALSAWFDKLGIEQELIRPFVHMVNPTEKYPSSNNYYGYLAGEDGKTFTLVLLNLAEKTFVKAEGWKSEPSDERKVLAAESEDWSERTRDLKFYQDSCAQGVPAVVFWLSQKRNYKELQVKSAEKVSGYLPSNGEYWPIDKTWKNYVAEGVLSAIVYEYESVPLTTQVERLRRLETRYQGTAGAQEAVGMREQIEKGLIEEKTREPIPLKEVDALPIDARVKELVWQLRFSRLTNTEAYYLGMGSAVEERLISLGNQSLPTVIDAMTDRTYTKSLWHISMAGLRGRYSPRDILTVGDSAVLIFNSITGRRLDLSDDKRLETQAKARQWVGNVAERGEEVMLAEAVEKDPDNALAEAQQLVSKYPKSAFPVIQRALSKSVDRRGSYIGLLRNWGTTESIELLKRLMREEKAMSDAVAVAEVLYRTNRQLAVDSIIARWEKTGHGTNLDPDEPRCVFDFLVSCEDMRAWSFLVDEFKFCSPNQRASIIWSVDSRFQIYRWIPSDDVSVLVEKLLGQGLEDTAVVNGGMSVGEVSFERPKVSTLANFTLSAFLKNVYTFTPTTDETKLEAQRQVALKTYRSRCPRA